MLVGETVREGLVSLCWRSDCQTRLGSSAVAYTLGVARG